MAHAVTNLLANIGTRWLGGFVLVGTVCDGVIPTAAETFGLMITFPFHICLTPGWIELAALSHDGLTFSSFFESSAVLLDGLVCYLDLLGEVDVLLFGTRSVDVTTSDSCVLVGGWK